MSLFDRARTTSYSTLIETMCLSFTVFEIQPDICRKSPILTTPHRRSLASENQTPWGIVWCCLCDPTFCRFSRTPTCDRRTDTDRHRPMASTTDAQHRTVKTNLDFTEARDSEWQWHQLGHMQVCTLLQTDNHTSTPLLCFLQAGCLSCCPTSSVIALKARLLFSHCYYYQGCVRVRIPV